ncbi:PAP2-domain-containing protein, partial [Diplocarpon rosae]
SPASSIASIETSFNPADSIKALRAHRWSYYDAKYLVCVFSLSISQAPGPMMKTGASALLMIALLMPATRQFFLPVLPVLTWLLFFFNARQHEQVQTQWVRDLRSDLKQVYSSRVQTPYLGKALMFLFSAPGTLPVFAQTFGYMNIAGVAIQLMFPCSPPWYENMYGLAPANYSMEGSPAGLARIDKLLGVDMYTTNFTASPLVFGAFPSLHSGNAMDKSWRFDYDYVEKGDLPVGAYQYGLSVLDFHEDNSDEWTVGSSSSISSGSRSPVDESQSAWEGETLASQASDYEAELSDVIIR